MTDTNIRHYWKLLFLLIDTNDSVSRRVDSILSHIKMHDALLTTRNKFNTYIINLSL